jgi:hypothetical protein
LIIRYPLFDIAACAFSAKTYLPKSFGLHHCPMRKEKKSKRKRKEKSPQPNEIPIVPIDCPEPAQIEKESPKNSRGILTVQTFEFSDGHDDDRGDGLPDACASVQAQV